jgi:hypothetical protein
MGKENYIKINRYCQYKTLTERRKPSMIFVMKTRIFQKIVESFLISLLALFPAACQSSGPAVGGNAGLRKGAGDYMSVVKTRTVHLYPDTPDSSPTLEIALSLLESPEDKGFIMNTLYEGLGLDAYARKRLFGYDKMYAEMRNVAERIPDMSTSALNWYYNEAFAVDARNAELAVISREWEYYTGGAHGMRSKNYYVFSLNDRRRLALNDIIQDDAKPALDNLVEAALRKLMEIPDWIPLTEQGFFEDSVDKLEDFFLTPQGLGFQWDPYEIAPYSMGIIELVIPYSELTGILTGLGLSLTNDSR